MSSIPDTIREVLACPRCHGALADAGTPERPALRCGRCALSFPVEQGIPVLLLERATPAPQPQDA